MKFAIITTLCVAFSVVNGASAATAATASATTQGGNDTGNLRTSVVSMKQRSLMKKKHNKKGFRSARECCLSLEATTATECEVALDLLPITCPTDDNDKFIGCTWNEENAKCHPTTTSRPAREDLGNS